MVESARFHTFDNGLTLVAEPLRSLESAAFCLLVPSGSAFDPPERPGLATLTCELSLRGCGGRDNRQFVETLEALGVQRGDAVSPQHISFTGATLANSLPEALEIYADVVQRPHLAAEHLDSARQVVLQEILAIEDEPAQKVMMELRRRHYGDPWGRSSHGDAAGVEGATLDEIRQFQATGFSPQGTILAVAGKIEWDALRKQVERCFGGWRASPGRSLAPSKTYPRRDHLPYESSQTQIGVAFESVPYRHPDYFQAAGAVGVLSGGMSSRLFTEVREKRGLCYSVYASGHTTLERGSVLCYSGTSADRAQETLDVMLHELRRMADGVEASELARLKARIKSGLIMQQESSSARSGAIARDWYHLGRVRTLSEIGQLVDGLTCDSVNDYLRRHPPSDFTVVTLGPQALEVRGEVS